MAVDAFRDASITNGSPRIARVDGRKMRRNQRRRTVAKRARGPVGKEGVSSVRHRRCGPVIDLRGWVQIWAQHVSLVTTPSLSSRYGDWPRPRQVLYQAALRPDIEFPRIVPRLSGRAHVSVGKLSQYSGCRKTPDHAECGNSLAISETWSTQTV